MNKLLLLYLLFIIWLYVLYLLKREKLTAFYFIIGSSGLFSFIFLVFKNILSIFFTSVLEFILSMLNNIFSFYQVYPNYNMLFVNNSSGSISLVIDYECCGLIEILVASSIILFFPLFNFSRKLICTIIGFLYIMLANSIRLLVVTYVIYRYGNNFYYTAHSVVGRIVFYILTVIFYFYMLSWQQIKNQRVGRFDYN